MNEQSEQELFYAKAQAITALLSDMPGEDRPIVAGIALHMLLRENIEDLNSERTEDKAWIELISHMKSTDDKAYRFAMYETAMVAAREKIQNMGLMWVCLEKLMAKPEGEAVN